MNNSKEFFVLPDYINMMMENKWLGSKTEQRFLQKVKNGKNQKFTVLI